MRYAVTDVVSLHSIHSDEEHIAGNAIGARNVIEGTAIDFRFDKFCEYQDVNILADILAVR